MILKYSKISVVLFILFLPFSYCHSQVDFAYEHLFYDQKSSIRFSEYNEFSWIKFANKGTLSSKITFDYIGSLGSCGLYANINRGPKFEIIQEKLIIPIAEELYVTDKSALQILPGYFEIENPLMVYGNLNYRNFELSFNANFYSRSEIIQVFNTENNIGGFERTENKRYDILLSGTIGYNMDFAKISLGLLNVKLYSKQDLEKPDFMIRPFVGINCPLFKGYSTLLTNTREVKVLISQPVNFSWLQEEDPLNLSLSIKKSFEKYSYQEFGINALIPVSSNFMFSLGYKQCWGSANQLTKTEFDRWQNSIDNILGDDLIGGIDHTNVSLGFSIILGSRRDEFPIRLLDAKISQKHIYMAKSELYAYNPVGTIDVHNSANHPVNCQISLELPNQLGGYKTESLTIEKDEIKTIPIYLFLSKREIQSSNENVLMNVTAETEGKKQTLTTVPLTFFDRHSWDGKTWGLKYFITPDEPDVIANAKKKYIQSFEADSSVDENQKQFKILKNFISELGRNIKYVQDPTTTMYVDQVRYPVETIYDQTGDCDDLSVYLASHLMAVGIHCVLVDVKPQQKEVELPTAGTRQIGHIFLLVDTGIEVENIGETGLKEFQFVSRKSASGKITVWIPIETTLIGQGFEKAFQEGTAQYYREVIEKDGIINGTVHVYDL